MSQAKVIFTFDCQNITIQCSQEDKMSDICKKIASKLEYNMNSLLFLYNGNHINFCLKFKEQINTIDKNYNEMKILVYKNENNEYICPKCGEKIRIKSEIIDDLISSNNNIKDTVIGIKAQLENIVNAKNNSINLINNQLKNINIILNTLYEDINKNIQKLENYLRDSQNSIKPLLNKNIIKGILNIKPDEININKNKIALFNSEINEGIEVFLNNKKINMIKDNEKYLINYNFKQSGNYSFEIIFDENIEINNTEKLFEECSNIISLDFSNFDTSNVVNMYRMFHSCTRLKEIKGLDKFVTNKVINMCAMFQCCIELEYLDLSSFDTSHVNHMEGMFGRCYKLKKIKGIDKFNTSNSINMKGMFNECNELENLNLLNFDTSNVTDMSYMFDHCKKLKEIKGIDKFNTNKVYEMRQMFYECKELEYLDLSKFNTSNVKDMRGMFEKCNKLKHLNLSNFTINEICDTEDMLSFEGKKNCKFIAKNKDLIKLYNTSKK